MGVKKNKYDIKALADTVVEMLKREGFAVLRYDAYSTKSIYLKLDYGVARSIRISDHTGKSYLKYAYNLIFGYNGRKFIKDEGFWRLYYNHKDVDKMLEDILKDRNFIKDKVGGEEEYQLAMDNKRSQNEGKRGFWAEAKLV